MGVTPKGVRHCPWTNASFVLPGRTVRRLLSIDSVLNYAQLTTENGIC
jgi:hypothetical protein